MAEDFSEVKPRGLEHIKTDVEKINDGELKPKMERVKEVKRTVGWLEGKKSFLISIATIGYAIIVVGWQNGDWTEAMMIIWGALGFSALRAGISNETKKIVK